MEEGSVAGTKTTAAARDPTAGCDVACSECVAEAGGSAVVEGLDAVGIMPLYAKPVLAAGRAAPQRRHLVLSPDTSRNSSSSLGMELLLQCIRTPKTVCSVLITPAQTRERRYQKTVPDG